MYRFGGVVTICVLVSCSETTLSLVYVCVLKSLCPVTAPTRIEVADPDCAVQGVE